jgi:hypothetical protein
VTEWGIGASYQKGSVFGAYLLSNYGGAALLKDTLANDAVGVASITEALDKYSSGLTFEKALMRFGEAMFFSNSSGIPNGAVTLDKTVAITINNFDYTAKGTDVNTRYGITPGLPSAQYPGPHFFDLTPIEMRPHSFSLHTASEWKNKSGNVSITLNRPSDPNVKFYLILK